ncbi:polysaccharide deacetylase family protein [Blastochloris viridis]|uniref:Chitooligosaccharide deacetylase n=1 Tax=Blastochloris viridis TaxID=1079 RepID=A0A0H5BG70_BLAVI|nr:polysaccharide deacetylase family protein [Blastochloris viridis]ALK09970.1 Polysaccharide deacetylase [Blastochloris viridis]BAS00115.1 polysaccharide deacetylase [Blastochloris viridis]CUU42633.1 Polysaccharide deacetylase [Blastochloris viridis]
MSALQSAKRVLKYQIIRVGLEAVALSRLGRLMPAAAGRGVVFTLHHVRPETPSRFDPNAILAVTPAFLEQAIGVALTHGLTAVHLHDLPALLADPAETRKFVAFTLDDGYRNNAEFAAPVFRKFGVPYTIFVTSGFTARIRTIWWETAAALAGNGRSFRFDFGAGAEVVTTATVAERFAAFERLARLVQSIDEDEAVRRLDRAAAAHGIDADAIVADLVMAEDELRALAADPLVHFGAHTVTHVNLKRVTAARLEEEIADSTRAVEAMVGRRPRSFSYPYGWSSAVGDREIAATASAGFAVAVTTQPGVLPLGPLERPTGLHRVSLNGYYQKPRYVEALISGIPFRLMA